MDRTEWFLGLISWLLAAVVLELGLEGFILYQLSVLVVLYALPVYLIGYPIYAVLAE